MAAMGLVLLSWGLAQTFYLGTVTNAFERDRTGNMLILIGALVTLAAAVLSRFRGDPLWITAMVAAPAVVIGGLNLAAAGSLLPHFAALAAVPIGLAGIVGGAVSRRRRTRS